ncbi:phosphatases II [Hygrophoropsis aurantiaca]|uniref:Phosphatases II n=1 Tax=Hygrophoropsis aurantiaca TaxID=72124 RepID=A0ACB8AQY9_9AGAM|nr:phosphatases II [Hygrophoropsis aurantiaca]
MKKLSINLPSAHSSSNSLVSPLSEPQSALDPPQQDVYQTLRPRRPSVLSLPNTAITPALHRKDEGGSPSAPYLDGPIQIMPGVWLGSEENARDWPGLIERGIKAILNVAKEVTSPFDSVVSRPMRPFVSTPNLHSQSNGSESTYYPPHIPSGRPGMHYLKLLWSHGQSDLVQEGFPTAMAFVDAALQRNEGVLIHCQCGISRSATLVIALVMRAAATCSPSVEPEIWQLKGMQAAYSFVKEKSKHVGPNMSLVYQLLEYEKALKGESTSPSFSDRSSYISDEEREWGRRRSAYTDDENYDRESDAVQQEAQDLDRAMEERIIARKPSTSSMASSSGVGMGPAWRSRYGRKRAGSVASVHTTGSVLSEDLVEADEEQELLGVGGGFDDGSEPRRSPCLSLSSDSPGTSESSAQHLTSTPFAALSHSSTARSGLPPSAPPTKLSFNIPPPPITAIRSTFNMPPAKGKRRPPPLGILPPVPPSPITPIAIQGPEEPPRIRPRALARKPAPPPLNLRRNSSSTQYAFPPKITPSRQPVTATPSQTLFVFPPSPTHVASALRTPSTMTITSNTNNVSYPFPSVATPRIATSRSHGRTRSFIGLGPAGLATTAHSRVDARGWVGLE